LYYGFVAVPGGSDRTITLYDHASAASGLEVEDFVADGTKKSDGHSHTKPVLCLNGLYLSMSGGTVVVYYSNEHGDKPLN
jgi:hypothetical protein